MLILSSAFIGTYREGNDLDSAFSVPAVKRLDALSRWENQGGALAQTDPEGLATLGVPPLSNTEMVQLRIRVVALENLLLAFEVTLPCVDERSNCERTKVA
jgi:hypothetical protein